LLSNLQGAGLMIVMVYTNNLYAIYPIYLRTDY
jgi:hypothetical protein